MSEFVLITGMIATIFALIWQHNTWINTFFKVFFCYQAMWAAYLLFGPENLITKF